MTATSSDDGGGRLNTGLLDAFGAGVGVRRAAALASFAGPALAAVKRGHAMVRARLAWSVTVESTDDCYADIHDWVLDQIPPDRRRALRASTSRSESRGGLDTPAPAGRGHATEQPRVRYLYDSTRSVRVRLDGHRVDVEVEQETSGGNTGDDYLRFRRPDRIRFTAYSAEGRTAIDAFLRRVAEARYALDRVPQFHMATKWGHWEFRRDLPLRSLDTVCLPDGQKERMVADVERFLSEEPVYARLGVPWHRGILLHGVPGGGKTSLARAIATRFRMDVYFVALSDLSADSGLLQLVAGVPPRSMLLLEDIDVLHAAGSRDDVTDGLSLSGLLNALDGVGTPHGLLTVMTTNHREVLDPALIRPGRIDMDEEIGLTTPDQVAGIWSLAFGAEVEVCRDSEAPMPSAAEVVEVCKRHLGNEAAAREALAREWSLDVADRLGDGLVLGA